MEQPKPRENLSFQGRMEFLPSSQGDMKKLESSLVPLVGKDAAEQCAFVLRSMAGEDFRNHCDEAAKEFGTRLAERFGGEESFFDLTQEARRQARFIVARSYSPSLDKIGYQKARHHDIALLEFPDQKGKAFSLAFDLTYGTVATGEKNRDRMLVLYAPGTEQEALETIKKNYGGAWKKELAFNPEKGTFAFRG